MRIIVEEDRITAVRLMEGIEVGQLPRGAPLSRLRYTGSEVVDLANLSEMWVRQIGVGAFELHAIQVPHSQLVSVSWSERDKLINDNGTIRVRTSLEEEELKKQEQLAALKARLELRLGRQRDLNVLLIDLIALLILYAREQPSAVASFFDALIPHIQAMFTLDQVQTDLQNKLSELKIYLKEYYDDRDLI